MILEFWDPLHISGMSEAENLKFGTPMTINRSNLLLLQVYYYYFTTTTTTQRCARIDFSYQILPISITSLPFASHIHLKLKFLSHIFPSSNFQIPPIPIWQLKRDIILCEKVGCSKLPEQGAPTLQTTDRQTDGRPMTYIYSDHELEFTFAKNVQWPHFLDHAV